MAVASVTPSWRPRSVAQELALACPAFMTLFGGAAGSLKSETLLMDAALERENPRLNAAILRRSYPELEKSLIPRAHELYGAMGARWNGAEKLWSFPSGARIQFIAVGNDDKVFALQGAEFSFLGFDESTHFREFPVRYLVSRVRSTDPSLALRVRLATNPGNVGHAWHRSLFLGPTCIHCQPGPSSRRAGQIYDDAAWPSDNKPCGFSTCFIPGRITDHSLLGEEYRQRLAGLETRFVHALLEGCWAAFEGQYFDCWNHDRMVVPAREVAELDWYTSWVGADYGFSISQAAAYRFVRAPATAEHPHGRIFVVDEYTAAHETAPAFARSLWRRFATEGRAAPRKIQAWYLSPDAFSDRGEGHSLADQMQRESGIVFQPAAADRAGGAMMAYTMLDRGELAISSACRQLIEALPSRIHDPKRADDVRKVPGDPLDDAYDAFRYGVYSWPRTPQRPAAEALEEAVRGAPDATQAMMRWRREMERQRREAQPKKWR